ncbi:MAG: hypothetical protein ABIP91_07045 [Sphingomicrobium sp.]
MAKLFLDCDGVLADFDAGVQALLGMNSRQYEARHGRGAFWKRLAQAPDFYANLPEMADAHVLFDSVRHLHPTILTGLPLGKWAAPQKIAWAATHFPGVPIITCMARDKHKHMQRGDVLVDDRENHRAAYEAAGVRFVHHVGAADSIRQLAEIFPSVKAAA